MNTQSGNPLPRGWLVVALLWHLACLNYLDRILITTMGSSLKSSIAMSESQFGLLTSVFLFSYGAFSPIGGFLADRFSRSHVIILSAFVWSAVTWLTGHVTNYEQLLVARFLMGISEACYMPAALALIADYHRGPTRSLATGIHMTGTFVGGGLGGLGGYIAESHGWQHAFIIFGAVGVAYSLVLIFLLRDPKIPSASNETSSHESNQKPSIRAAVSFLAHSRSFWLMTLFWGLFGVAGWVILGWMPTYLKEAFSLGQGAAGLSATGYFQIAAMVGVIFGGKLADKWSRTNPLGRVYIPSIGLVIAAIGLLGTSLSPVLSGAIVGLALCGFTRAFTDANMMPILCIAVPARYRATGYGILNLVGCVAGGVMIYVGGVLRDQQTPLTLVFTASAVALAGCAAILLLVAKSMIKSGIANDQSRQ